MRSGMGLVGAAVLSTLLGCAGSDYPDGPSQPGPPVPLKEVVLDDVSRFHGGERVWIGADRTAFIQVVDSKEKEKRYRRAVTDEQRAEVEKLVGQHDFLSLQEGPFRKGVPDEPGHTVRLVTQDGRRAKAFKWGGDRRPRFDPVAGELFKIAQESEGRDLIYEGEYDPDWVPDGFEKPW